MKKLQRYTVRIGDAHCIAEHLTYDDLLARVLELTVRGAVARSIDESNWEEDELRRNGLAALQIVRDDRAIWAKAQTFEAELEAARREHAEDQFRKNNELDPGLYDRLDRDLRARWRSAGYEVGSLRADMKRLYLEVQKDADQCSSSARDHLIDEILRGSGVL